LTPQYDDMEILVRFEATCRFAWKYHLSCAGWQRSALPLVHGTEMTTNVGVAFVDASDLRQAAHAGARTVKSLLTETNPGADFVKLRRLEGASERARQNCSPVLRWTPRKTSGSASCRSMLNRTP
jgi:hypothetical protein